MKTSTTWPRSRPRLRRQRTRVPALALTFGLVAASCSSNDANVRETTAPAAGSAAGATAPVGAEVLSGEAREFGEAPDLPDEPSDPAAEAALDQIVSTLASSDARALDPALDDELAVVGATGDPRFAWALSDILRFSQGSRLGAGALATIETLTGTTFDPLSPWGDTVDHLIAWDQPANDGYRSWKPRLFGAIDSRWEPLFAGGDAIDLRHVSWGGVLIDDRPLGDTLPCPRGCIPALDDPAVTDADGGSWYPDDATVFGVVINGEARAYPKNIMEVHEMVNDTLGGRRVAIPYCTLCGSAQAYLTDELDEAFDEEFDQPVLRTSGLLIRSNKMMYELVTGSFVDTFLGTATSGPLAAAGVSFEQVSVVRSNWADWREAHPETTIIAEDGGIGRTYAEDPLRGRDDDGPIFPIGDTDPRLPVQESVLGVTTEAGVPLAFHVGAARAALLDGRTVGAQGVEVVLDGNGVRAVDSSGDSVESHEAFWFAWSQFHPETLVWPVDA